MNKAPNNHARYRLSRMFTATNFQQELGLKDNDISPREKFPKHTNSVKKLVRGIFKNDNYPFDAPDTSENIELDESRGVKNATCTKLIEQITAESYPSKKSLCFLNNV